MIVRIMVGSVTIRRKCAGEALQQGERFLIGDQLFEVQSRTGVLDGNKMEVQLNCLPISVSRMPVEGVAARTALWQRLLIVTSPLANWKWEGPQPEELQPLYEQATFVMS